MNSSIWEHFASGSFSPGTSPAFLSGPGAAELARLRQELEDANGTIKQWEESWQQAKQVDSPRVQGCGHRGALHRPCAGDASSQHLVSQPQPEALPKAMGTICSLYLGKEGSPSVPPNHVEMGPGRGLGNELPTPHPLQACDAWKKEAEEAGERASAAGAECELAREQRDALEVQVKRLQEELERLHAADPALPAFSDLEALSLATLYSLQKQLRAHLERVDKVGPEQWVRGGGGSLGNASDANLALTDPSPSPPLPPPPPQAVFHMQSVKCLQCQEQDRAVLPCQHAVLCELCAQGSECPVCQPGRAHALQS